MTGLRCEVVTPAELGAPERARWAEIRQASPELASPFFAYEFTASVAAARADARVAVLERDRAIVGFLPFHAGRTAIGRPIGTKLSDYQGAIVEPSVEWSAPELVRLAGLRAYSFDHLVAAQAPFRPFFARVDVSPVIDLSEGYEAYLRGQREAGRDDGLREAAKKRRRLERRFAVRFELHEPDRRAVATLLCWKSEQYRRTGVFDVLSRPWVIAVLERLHATQTDELAGVLSCLYADEKLIAVHFGIRAGCVLHSWFPAYDVEYAKLSPGLVLLQAIVEAAPAHGIRTIDLGKGSETYKDRLANRAIELGAGSLELDRASALAARLARAAWFVPLRSPLYTRAHRLRQRLQLG